MPQNAVPNELCIHLQCLLRVSFDAMEQWVVMMKFNITVGDIKNVKKHQTSITYMSCQKFNKGLLILMPT